MYTEEELFLPIEVASRYGLNWDDGLQNLAEATSGLERRNSFYVTAHYGGRPQYVWNGMEHLVTSHAEMLERKDLETGLLALIGSWLEVIPFCRLCRP